MKINLYALKWIWTAKKIVQYISMYALPISKVSEFVEFSSWGSSLVSWMKKLIPFGAPPLNTLRVTQLIVSFPDKIMLIRFAVEIGGNLTRRKQYIIRNHSFLRWQEKKLSANVMHYVWLRDIEVKWLRFRKWSYFKHYHNWEQYSRMTFYLCLFQYWQNVLKLSR